MGVVCKPILVFSLDKLNNLVYKYGSYRIKSNNLVYDWQRSSCDEIQPAPETGEELVFGSEKSIEEIYDNPVTSRKSKVVAEKKRVGREDP